MVAQKNMRYLSKNNLTPVKGNNSFYQKNSETNVLLSNKNIHNKSTAFEEYGGGNTADKRSLSRGSSSIKLNRKIDTNATRAVRSALQTLDRNAGSRSVPYLQTADAANTKPIISNDIIPEFIGNSANGNGFNGIFSRNQASKTTLDRPKSTYSNASKPRKQGPLARA